MIYISRSYDLLMFRTYDPLFLDELEMRGGRPGNIKMSLSQLQRLASVKASGNRD
jgi:hypothetical protein